jgi:hypothetical protein
MDRAINGVESGSRTNAALLRRVLSIVLLLQGHIR